VAIAAVVACLDVFSKFTVELAKIADMLVHLTTVSVFTAKVQREKPDIN